MPTIIVLILVFASLFGTKAMRWVALIVNLIIPDTIPYIDEIVMILGVLDGHNLLPGDLHESLVKLKIGCGIALVIIIILAILGFWGIIQVFNFLF